MNFEQVQQGGQASSHSAPATLLSSVASNKSGSGFFRKLQLSALISVASVVCLAIYISLRVAYMLFYDRFGITPEEVGLGEPDVLVQSAIPLIVASLFSAIVVLSSIALDRRFPTARMTKHRVALTREEFLRFRRRQPASPDRVVTRRLLDDTAYAKRTAASITHQFGYGHIGRTALEYTILFDRYAHWNRKLLIVAGLIVLATADFAIFPWAAIVTGENGQHGHAVHGLFGPVHAFPFRAEPARLYVVSANSPDTARLASRRCLMYLGQGQGDIVVYDVDAKESLRVPSASITVSINPGRHTCRDK